MPRAFFGHIRKSAAEITYNSTVYNWSLRGDVPDRLIVRPIDPWPGNVDHGRWLCGGSFLHEGDQLDIEKQAAAFFRPQDPWPMRMHDFSWLRDLRAVNGEIARRQAQNMIQDWIDRYAKWDAQIWSPGTTGHRIAMWVALHEFYAGLLHDEFNDRVFESIARQARHLARVLDHDVQGLEAFNASKGLLYAGLGFEGRESWAEYALSIISEEIDKQILPDGMHISRSPAILAQVLQILVDVKSALICAGYPLAPKIQHAIDRMGPALRFFRYADKGFALFNGAQEGDINLIDYILGQANPRGKALQSLPCGGYERLTLGRTSLVIDTGKTPPYPHDRYAHAAPLAFEMCHGKDRIFVSCGTHAQNTEWREALRGTAAHTALSLGGRNASEIRADGHIGRPVRSVKIKREEQKDNINLEASHDGYAALNGIIHQRSLRLSDKGYDLHGRDFFDALGLAAREAEGTVRFHIHPRVNVSLIRNGQEAFMRVPGGMGWRFYQKGGTLALEDSVYLGDGSEARKTKQLVISFKIKNKDQSIEWGMQREG